MRTEEYGTDIGRLSSMEHKSSAVRPNWMEITHIKCTTKGKKKSKKSKTWVLKSGILQVSTKAEPERRRPCLTMQIIHDMKGGVNSHHRKSSRIERTREIYSWSISSSWSTL